MNKSDIQEASGEAGEDQAKPKRGGARPGAGRPPKREVYAANIGEAEALIAKELPALLKKYFELAAGVKVQGKAGRNGGETVYERPPDGKVIADLLNRVMGKPVERIETENTGDADETTIIILPDNGRASSGPSYSFDPEKERLSYGED